MNWHTYVNGTPEYKDYMYIKNAILLQGTEFV